MHMSKYHTFWPRFWSGLIDALVFIPVMFVDFAIDSPERGKGLFLAWTTVSTLSLFLYSVLLHWRYGQTLGKRVCGVSVLDVSESRTPTLAQALARDAGWIAIEIAGLANIFWLVLSGQYSHTDASAQGVDLIVTWAAGLWFALEMVTMLTNDKRRALHDMLAKTVVVRVAQQTHAASREG
jgi:uncharacterized RDD family membrane protein YckC